MLFLLENRSSVSLAPIGSSWRKSPANIMVNPPEDWLRFPISLSFLSSFLKDGITHEWYLVNYNNLCILPFIFIINAELFVLIEKCSHGYCNTTKQWCCQSCVHGKNECFVTPHYTHCYTKFVAKLLCNFPGSAAFPWTSRPGKNHQELVPSTSCL